MTTTKEVVTEEETYDYYKLEIIGINGYCKCGICPEDRPCAFICRSICAVYTVPQLANTVCCRLTFLSHATLADGNVIQESS